MLAYSVVHGLLRTLEKPDKETCTNREEGEKKKSWCRLVSNFSGRGEGGEEERKDEGTQKSSIAPRILPLLLRLLLLSIPSAPPPFRSHTRNGTLSPVRLALGLVAAASSAGPVVRGGDGR